MSTSRRRIATLAVSSIAALSLGLAGCSVGEIGGDSGSTEGQTEITYLFGDSGGTAVEFGEALTKKFNEMNPDIKVTFETQPGGHRGRQPDEDQAGHRRDGRRLPLQLRLAVPGAQPGQQPGSADRRGLGRGPRRTSSSAWSAPTRAPYGAPTGTTRAGGVLYNKKVYADLGLKVPDHLGGVRGQQRQDQGRRQGRLRSSRPTARPGPRSCSCSATSPTSPRRIRVGEPVHRQQAQVRRPAGPAELQEPAGRVRVRLLQQELRLGQVRRRHQGRGHRHGGALPDADQRHRRRSTRTSRTTSTTSGFFALPAQDAANTQMTIWLPTPLYIPKTTEGAKLEAAKKFVAFVNSPEGCEIQTGATR